MGTLIVSFVAITVSVSASRLARQVEEQREAAAAERAADSARARLQEMAVREAKLVHRWVVESRRPRFGMRGVPIGSPPPPPTPLEAAEIEATVELEHSIVPGADAILRLTKFDVEKRRAYVETDTAEGAWRSAVFCDVVERRDERTDDRIRAWALDSREQSPVLQGELRKIDDDPMGYLFFDQTIEEVLPG